MRNDNDQWTGKWKVPPKYINNLGHVHPGLIFLSKAAFRFTMVERGEMHVDDAMNSLFLEADDYWPPEECPRCARADKIYADMERLHPPKPPKTRSAA